MNNENIEKKRDNLRKQTILMNIYALLAVILVIIPERIAELALTVENRSKEPNLPRKSKAWKERKDLRFSTMSFRKIRKTALRLGIHGYSADNRDELTKRIIRRLKLRNLLVKLISKAKGQEI